MKRWIRLDSMSQMPLGKDGRRVTASSEHIALSRRATSECAVLLKNTDNALPIKGTIAPFGKGIVDYVKGGGGSGDVTTLYSRSVLDGLLQKEKEGKVSIFKPLSDYYAEYVRSEYENGGVPGLIDEPVFPFEYAVAASKANATPLIIISRFSGENWDRASEGDPIFSTEEGTLALLKKEAEIFSRGDFYLSEKEEKMVETVLSLFGSAVVVLNVGGVMDVSWIADDNRIKAALHIFQGGMAGGEAAADILVGDTSPSGRLSDTYARTLAAYPSTKGFHDSLEHVYYNEDIFVGYRYFSTIPGAKEKVIYPFGYGLSYTSFSLAVKESSVENRDISLLIEVRNTGKAKGKDVVEIYAELPIASLDKPRTVLAAFGKTRELEPCESELLSIRFYLDDIASYDEEGVIEEASWVLEKGRYNILMTDDAIRYDSVLSVELEDHVIIEKLSHHLLPKESFSVLRSDGTEREVRFEEKPAPVSIYPRLQTGEEYILPGERVHERLSFEDSSALKEKSFEKVLEGSLTLDDFVSSLPDDILVDLLGGQPNKGLANTFGFGNQREYGIPSVMTADGPAGLRILPEHDVYSTAWPCATAIASSWDMKLAEAIGKAVGEEVKENGFGLYLAPAVNIHRSPLCGRNFEYYSEDPLLAGQIGAAAVRGIQSNGVGACVKHFALNNKETNRKSSDSIASERAIREIYLRQFEIIIKEASPVAIMSSYNIINGVRASENKELLTDILRGEWGFEGFVTTDWWTLGEQYLEIKAGNDLKMGTGYPERLLDALEKGVITKKEIELSVKHILSAFMRLE